MGKNLSRLFEKYKREPYILCVTDRTTNENRYFQGWKDTAPVFARPKANWCRAWKTRKGARRALLRLFDFYLETEQREMTLVAYRYKDENPDPIIFEMP